MTKYVQKGAFDALYEALGMFNLSAKEVEEVLDRIVGDDQYEEVEERTLNHYDGRVYIIKCQIHGENTLGIGIPDTEEDYWKYLHIYPETTPYDVQKIYQITDFEVIDVVAELFGHVGQVRPAKRSKLLTDEEANWIADNFRVQGV